MDLSDANQSQISKLMQASKSVQTDPITATLLENQLNTVEQLTDFFMEVYKKEMAVYKINESIVLETVSKLPADFRSEDSGRCSYMYCYATCHTLLVKDCITRFLNEYPKSEDLIKAWKSSLNISSLSFGPSIDCVAFSLAVLEVSKDPSVVYNVSVIFHVVNWIFTVEILSEVFQEVKTPLNIKYVSEKVMLKSLLKTSNNKELLFLQNSNVLLVFQPFTTAGIKTSRNAICELVKLLRSGTLIFSITPSSQTSEMRSILEENQGTFLYGPVTVPSPELMVEVSEKCMKSVPSTAFEFFVWVKDFDPLAFGKCHEKLQQPMNFSKKRALREPNRGYPPKKVQILRNGLKRVEMLHSFFVDEMYKSNFRLESKGTQTDLVSEAILENKLNTDRLVTDFFMEVFKSEVAQFLVKGPVDLFNLSELFSSHRKLEPKARCAYMYYYATCHTLLMKKCMVEFLKGYPKASSLLTKLRYKPDHCSLSHSPGLDYIAFSLAVLEVSKQPTAITKAHIITTDNNWGSTVNILSEVIQRVKTPLNLHFNLSSIYTDLNKNYRNSQAVKHLKSASVVFMFKTPNLVEKGTATPPLLKDIVEFMSPGTLIFFMDSASRSYLMEEVLEYFSGTFLFGPTPVSCDKLQVEVSEELMKSMKLPPAQDAEVEFFVWEKISNIPPPHLSWRTKNGDAYQKKSCPRMKIENKNEIADDVSSRNSDVSRMNVLSDRASTSSSDSGFSASVQKQPKPCTKTKPVVSKKIMELKKLMESTNEPDGANVVDSCELAAQKVITAPIDDHSAPLNSADTELPLVSKSPSEMGTTKTLSDDQEDKVNSLIARIDEFASSIEHNFEAASQMSVNEGSVNVTEINLLTKRIDKLVTTLESNIYSDHQSSKSRSHKCNCHCSCKMHSSPCQNSCDMTTKSSQSVLNFTNSSNCVPSVEKTDLKSDKGDIQHGRSSNCHIVPSQFLGHRVRACYVHQPSIVIPLENITPDLLSLILNSKK